MTPVQFDRSVRSANGIRGYRLQWNATLESGPWANIGDYRPDLAVRDHYHPYLTVDTVIRGRGVYRDRHGGRPCEPATLIIVNAGEVHDARPVHGGMTILSIGTTSKWLHEAGLPAASPNRAPTHPELALRVFRLFSEAHIGDASSVLAIEEMIIHILDQALGRTELLEGSRHMPTWLHGVMARLHDDPSRPETLRSLADEIGIHFTHLARTFKARFGCTIGEYQRLLRLVRSIPALVGSREPLARIALDAGYCDQSHYHRCFQRVMNIAPGTFRRVATRSDVRDASSIRAQRYSCRETG